jgi:amidophosphoribosyltransferase
LTDDLDPQERGPQDACGVFGVWAPEEEVAKLTYFGLFALQHRGQEAAGIAVSDGAGVVVYKDLGLVSQVFDEPTLASLRGHLAIGHTRYSTTGGSNWENAQPTIRATTAGTTIALAHNGNLVNTAELAREVADRGLAAAGSAEIAATSDTALVTTLLAGRPDLSVEAAAMEVLPRLRGAFSFVFMDETTLYAARDAQGVRPLVLGRMERGWTVASETAALDIVGASSSVRWSRARSWRSTSTACAPPGSPPRSRRAACSSTSTWPVRTPRSPVATSIRPGSRWAAGWRRSTRSRPTW